MEVLLMKKSIEIVAVLLMPCLAWAAGESVPDSLDRIPIYEMPGITVTATRVPARLSDVPLGTQVITGSEIAESGAQDAGELLKSGIGVDVKSYGYVGSVSSVSIRGSTTSQVLVLVDGRPINSVSLGTADLSEIALSDVKRVEVVRGPVSSLYGANALGGVINIITGLGGKSPSLTGRTEFGSHGRLMYGSTASSVLGDLGFDFSANWRAADGERENSDYRAGELWGRLAYSGIEWLKGDITAAIDKSELGLPGPLPAEGSIPKYGSKDVTSLFGRQKDRKGHGDLSLEMRLNETSTARTKFYHDRRYMDYHSVYDGWDASSFSYFKAVEDDDYETVITGASFQLDLQPFRGDRLVAGLDASVSKFDARSSIQNDSTKQEAVTHWVPSDSIAGIYVENEWRPKRIVVLVGSARYDWSRAYGSRVSPSLGLTCNLSSDVRAKASIGRAFRAPTLNDLYWPEQEFMGGNKDVRPENGIGSELRMEYEPFEAMSLAGSVFRRDVQDLIAWAPAPDGKWRPTNVNEFHSKGVEMELKVAPVRAVRIRGNLMYLEASQKNREVIRYDASFIPEYGIVERRAAFVPEVKGSLSASCNLPSGFDFMLGVDHIGRQVSYWQVTDWNKIPPETLTNEKWLNSAAVANGTVGFAIGPEHFFAKVENIFNARSTDMFGSLYEDRDYPRPERVFSYGMDIKLQ
jgi:outer membrane cobalamin receptor